MQKMFSIHVRIHGLFTKTLCLLQGLLPRLGLLFNRGTITALAETNTRVTGDADKTGSLTVLRRQRLKTLLELLMNEPAAERAAMISGDPKRADIIIAGGFVLHEIMTEIGLDYLFVSRRGLRDGLMVDLLQRHYSETGPWRPDADRTESLDQVCQKYLYDAPH